MTLMQKLEQHGYKVFVRHYRYYPSQLSPLSEKEAAEYGLHLSECESRGGETEVEIYQGKDHRVAKGLAKCSNNDNYNRRMGREIAIGRAMVRHGLQL